MGQRTESEGRKYLREKKCGKSAKEKMGERKGKHKRQGGRDGKKGLAKHCADFKTALLALLS